MKRTQYIKMLIIFMLVTTINISLIQFLNFTGLKEVEIQDKEKTREQLVNVANNILKDINDINNLTLDLLANSSVRLLTLYRYKLDDILFSKEMTSMQEKLTDLESRSSLIQNLGLIIISPQKGIYTGHYDTNFNKLLEQNLFTVPTGGNNFVTINNNLYFVKMFESIVSNNKAIAVAKVSNDELTRQLKPIVSENDDYIYINDNKNRYLLEIGKKFFVKSFSKTTVEISSTNLTITKYSKMNSYNAVATSFNILNLITITIFFIMVFIYTRTARTAYNKTLLAQRAQLRQYQSQIAPHFLYNSFYTQIRMLDLEEYENLKQFTKYLGDYFKFLHSGDDEDQVRLDKELENAKIYSYLQEMRFRRRIKVDFQDIEGNINIEKYLSNKVPRLIIQPIVENAFEHSLENKEYDGLLRVSMNVHNNVFIVKIEDNGEVSQDLVEECKSKITSTEAVERLSAIMNIHRRLQIAFGGKSGLSFEKSELGGLLVYVKIDFGK